MKTPPSFQFYPDDFMAGVADMTQAEVGAYILLLCQQWNRGSIPVQPERQQLLAKGLVSEHVLAKFQVGPDGTLRNARLESTRQKLNEYCEKQRKKGILSGISRSNNSEPRFNRGSTVAEPSWEPQTNSPVSSLQSPILKPPTPFHGVNGDGTGKTSEVLLLDSQISEKPFVPNLEQIRLGKLLKRRPTTKWTLDEIRYWKMITPINEEDFKLVERYYFGKHPPDKDYRKTELVRILKNWNGQVDRARNYKPPNAL